VYAHRNWLRYFIRRDQREVLADVSEKSLLLRIGYQLAERHPEFFSEEQLRLSVSVEQHFGTVAEQGEAVGIKVRRLLDSPFHQTVLKAAQRVQSNQEKVVGVTLLAKSNIVTLHPSFTNEIGSGPAMKSTALFLNTARGELTDEEAMAQAVEERRIASAALDTFTQERLSADSPLRRVDPERMILTPYNIADTRRGGARI